MHVGHFIEAVSDQYSMITTCIPRNDDASKELDVIKREIIGNPELESQNIYDIINGGNLITCGVIIGIVGVVIKPAWRKSI